MILKRNLALTPGDKCLILGYKCLSNCVHCLYNISPGWLDWMTLDEVAVAVGSCTLLNEGYAGKRHLCVDVRNNLIKAGVLTEHLKPEKFYQFI